VRNLKSLRTEGLWNCHWKFTKVQAPRRAVNFLLLLLLMKSTPVLTASFRNSVCKCARYLGLLQQVQAKKIAVFCQLRNESFCRIHSPEGSGQVLQHLFRGITLQH
jgi:hypothetical protein